MAKNLHSNWIWVRLEKCVNILDSQRKPVNRKEREKRISGESFDQLYPYYGATGQVGWIDDYIFDEELVLLGEDGAPFFDPLKIKSYIIKGKTWVNNHAHVLKALENILLNKFLCHYLNTFDYNGFVTGTTRSKLNQSPLRKIPVPLAPLPEQHRIVAKIEELFTKLDAGVDALQKIKAQFKRYRQSVLKAAFSGKLTAQWREEHKDELEPGSVLLEKIKEARSKNKEKYKELPPVDTSDLPELPEGWEWEILQDYSWEVKDGTHDTPKYQEEGIPFITQKNIKNFAFQPSNHKCISVSDHNKFFKRSNPEKGDILISMIGANRGMSCIVDTDTVFSIKNVGLVKPFPKLNNIKYIFYYLLSQKGQELILERSKGGAQPFIGLTELRNWRIIVAPMSEQQKIVEEIERHFSIADEIEKTIEQGLMQAERLRQSILKKAFAGKLVPQDPNDEPAEKLLERIKQEKARLEQQKKNKTSKH